MRQQGANGKQHFRIVLKLGWYNPMGKTDPNYQIDLARIEHWLGMGAEISDRVRMLIKRAAPEIVQKLGEKKVAKMAKRRSKRKKKKVPTK